MNMTIKFLTFIFILCAQGAFGFDCKEVVGRKYMSPGDSDFQYHYVFKKDGVAALDVYMVNHDRDDHSKKSLDVDHFEGTYKVVKDTLIVKIEVDKVKHTINFSCKDKVKYMNVGKFSKSLQVGKTIPESHAFSMIHLWPANSSVIRADLSKK
ncbi:MAG: hypothetical protein K9K67_00645 [Bacteriovoracaceae bacterium]|nr:hypothetical protein [Bacteriovoracaceae bacterium]